MLCKPCIDLLAAPADVRRTLAIGRALGSSIIGRPRQRAVEQRWQRMERIFLASILDPLRKALESFGMSTNLGGVEDERDFAARFCRDIDAPELPRVEVHIVIDRAADVPRKDAMPARKEIIIGFIFRQRRRRRPRLCHPRLLVDGDEHVAPVRREDDLVIREGRTAESLAAAGSIESWVEAGEPFNCRIVDAERSRHRIPTTDLCTCQRQKIEIVAIRRDDVCAACILPDRQRLVFERIFCKDENFFRKW